MILFDEKERTYLYQSLHNENTYDYYDRSARKEVSNVRRKINEWFSEYPANEQGELKSRFKKSFSSTYFELFLHELFRQQGFEIHIHPEIPNTSKRPDFLIQKNNFECYVEAKEARDKSTEQEALKNKINHLYDSLNKMRIQNFFLGIDELILKSKRQPSTKRIIQKIEAELINFDTDIVLEKMNYMGFDVCPTILYEDTDLKMVIKLIPKTLEARTLDDCRPIGMYPYENFSGGSEDSIKDSFIKKSSRYGKLDKPYIVCINAIGMIGDGDFDVNNALWGSIAWTWSTDPNSKNERLERQPDGIFLGKNGSRCVNVSGVLVTKIMEFNLHVAKHWFAKHPYSQNDIDFNVFDLTHEYVSEGEIRKHEKKAIREILGIDDNWLDQ